MSLQTHKSKIMLLAGTLLVVHLLLSHLLFPKDEHENNLSYFYFGSVPYLELLAISAFSSSKRDLHILTAAQIGCFSWLCLDSFLKFCIYSDKGNIMMQAFLGLFSIFIAAIIMPIFFIIFSSIVKRKNMHRERPQDA